MEYVGIEAIRKEYAQDKINNGNYTRGLEIYQKDMQTPTFEGLAIHPETEPIKETINNKKLSWERKTIYTFAMMTNIKETGVKLTLSPNTIYAVKRKALSPNNMYLKSIIFISTNNK